MSQMLLVEDDDAIVKLVCKYIADVDSSITVNSFAKAMDALHYAKNHSIDLFILDIQLLDYKGTSLAKQIRAIPVYQYTPIVFATALAGEELSAYREVKCYSFLIKPFTKEEFTVAFRDALGLSQHMHIPSKTIRIEQKQFIFEYELKNILYIESFGKKIVIHSNRNKETPQEDVVSGYGLLKLLELIDDSTVIQCHKSFLVNTLYIEGIDKQNNCICLKNVSVKIPIGNKYQSALWG